MSVILGVDVGGSTTKIVALHKDPAKGFDCMQVRAGDQLTSLFGAMGNLLYTRGLSLSDVEKIVLTGVGAARIDRDIHGIPTVKVPEFEAIGLGGLRLAELEKAMVVSMGTGTAYVKAEMNTDGSCCSAHVGGSGMGGGTLVGLSSKILDTTDMEEILAMADKGDVTHVDLTIGDITTAEIPNLPPHATAASFGRVRSTATQEDFAIGLIHMIVQNAGVLAAFACRTWDIKDIVVTGTLATTPQAQSILNEVAELYNLRFIIPPHAAFATALGAAALHA